MIGEFRTQTRSFICSRCCLARGRPRSRKSRPKHINFRKRTLSVPKPKGGSKRAFDIPLSREMVRCLVRAIRFGREMYPLQATEWVFPADSESGHLAETKEDRDGLSKWGNDLRQTFRTIATAAGVSDFDAKLLMNHSIPGVNAGYITRHKLLEDHLRRQQQAISSAAFAALGAPHIENGVLRAWHSRGAVVHALSEVSQQLPKFDENNSWFRGQLRYAASRRGEDDDRSALLRQPHGFRPAHIIQMTKMKRSGDASLQELVQTANGLSHG